MFYGHARWLILLGLSGSALGACSSDPDPNPSGLAGNASGGSAAGAQTGGSSSNAGSNSSAGSTSGGSSAGNAQGGAAGATAGSGGAATAGRGGAGGAAGGSGGAAGAAGAGGGASMPTAVATIMGVNGQTVTGTATFTQGATMTTLVLDLTACPNGPHASHLHDVNDCGNNGDAALGHWPNGEGLGTYTCAGGKGQLTFAKATDKWTVGDGSATDVAKHSFMVHEMGDNAPGGRIGCGVIAKK